MPVTAKLSKQFYDRLGEAVTNELVDWFNQVDAAYKFDLREMNEMNFARFDAKLEQRFAESDANVERRFAEFEVKLERRLAEFRDDIRRIELSLEKRLGDQTRFFFLAWAVLLVSNIALWFR